jgi:hypothetical protein
MTMTKKRLILVVALPFAAIAMTVAVLAILPPRPGVTKANFDRIQEGMTRAEVEEIFGGPSSEDVVISTKDGKMIITFDQPRVKGWGADDGLAVIEFDEKGKTKEKSWSGLPLSLFDRIRRWLHLP